MHICGFSKLFSKLFLFSFCRCTAIYVGRLITTSSFNSSYVLVHNHARVDVFTTTSFPSLSPIGIAGGTQQQPWNYLNEPVWSLNVKRGILSAMQNSMRDLAVSELVFKVQLEVLMFNSLKFKFPKFRTKRPTFCPYFEYVVQFNLVDSVASQVTFS